eukprot:1979414-Rhodomonas_salina.2
MPNRRKVPPTAPPDDTPLSLFMANVRCMKPEHYEPIVLAWQEQIKGKRASGVPAIPVKTRRCSLRCMPICSRRPKTTQDVADMLMAQWSAEVQPGILDMLTLIDPTSEDAYALLDMHAIIDEALKKNDTETVKDAASAIIVFLLSCNLRC